MSVELRPARPADLAGIAALQMAAARAAWGHIAAPGGLDRLDPIDWAQRLEQADHATVACADDGEVVGFAFSEGNLLEYFFTDPTVWGTGAGRALLEETEAALLAAGHAEATLWTEERNHRPLRIYRRAGWYPDGGVREREWAGATIRELRLRKRLADSGR